MGPIMATVAIVGTLIQAAIYAYTDTSSLAPWRDKLDVAYQDELGTHYDVKRGGGHEPERTSRTALRMSGVRDDVVDFLRANGSSPRWAG
jgi:hypothetical protein